MWNTIIAVIAKLIPGSSAREARELLMVALHEMREELKETKEELERIRDERDKWRHDCRNAQNEVLGLKYFCDQHGVKYPE